MTAQCQIYSHNIVGDLSNKFYWYQIFALDSVAVQTEYCKDCMEAS